MDTVTLNISLPRQLAIRIDNEVISGQYTSRSEFFRMLLRFYESLVKRQILPLEFMEFQKRPLKEIKKGLVATGKYDQKFIRAILNGLKRESLYADS